jgi:hypothetical protein
MSISTDLQTKLSHPGWRFYPKTLTTPCVGQDEHRYGFTDEAFTSRNPDSDHSPIKILFLLANTKAGNRLALDEEYERDG